MSRDFIPVFGMVVAGHVLFRLAYLFYLGNRLSRARETEHTVRAPFTKWMSFRAEASFILFGDALTFMAICLGTLGTLQTGLSYVYLFLGGVALITAGLLSKLSLRLTYGDKDYYWYEAFDHLWRPRLKRGWHRWVENPVYTLSYWPVLGFAVLTESSWGLVFAAFDWVVGLTFHYWYGRRYAEPRAARSREAIQPVLTRRAS